MCIGTPAQLIALDNTQPDIGIIAVGGARREVDLSLIGATDESGQSRLGQWVLVHVGFAMSVLDEQQAKETLATLEAMSELESDVGAFLNNGGGSHALD
ncbi:HypC/HybG/HupF family hydrogenase formation chaperone [Celerinatantimonas diazotrophica]|uniref:Hydrogenase maturation protein HypC n=1 Tax=Celerinatantimonas diazotrophica TaxID=412034 RepID=A0A4R1K9N5_9GAMM|nr:HypC/HybG/HupF family hydrogenase formation chaperone [Celerinatantimonas diazotrophica]TCK61106.1 hydrogenase maturation protein HypC [Celerinatantimonas diazotrophica]CAG9295155.1 Hydrogenase maturation factor HypC [Celerinatantimonas diazotrophica]